MDSVKTTPVVLQVGVKILLINSEGKCLLLRRSLSKYPDISDIVGGWIEPGTGLLENLQREIKEETGLELVGEPKLLAAQDIFRKANHHIVRLTYVGKSRGEVVLDTEENDMYRWCTEKEFERVEDMDFYLKELSKKGVFEHVWRS